MMVYIISLIGGEKSLGLSVKPLSIALSLGAGLGACGTMFGSGASLVGKSQFQIKNLLPLLKFFICSQRLGSLNKRM